MTPETNLPVVQPPLPGEGRDVPLLPGQAPGHSQGPPGLHHQPLRHAEVEDEDVVWRHHGEAVQCQQVL